jgi:large subunit ribosomal protein L31
MKAKIHPKWGKTKVKCACGNTFETFSTQPEIEVEVCSACHPFYTGQMRFTGGAGRVEVFNTKKKAAQKTLSKTQKLKEKRAKRIQKKYEGLDSLAQLRKEKTKKSKKKK